MFVGILNFVDGKNRLTAVVTGKILFFALPLRHCAFASNRFAIEISALRRSYSDFPFNADRMLSATCFASVLEPCGVKWTLFGR